MEDDREEQDGGDRPQPPPPTDHLPSPSSSSSLNISDLMLQQQQHQEASTSFPRPYLMPPGGGGGSSGGGGIDWGSLLQLLLLDPAAAAAAAAASTSSSPRLLMEGLGVAAALSSSMTATSAVAEEKGKIPAGKGRKMSRPRFAFRTKSPNDILDDGYRWRKYGQKAVKNSTFPRSYYRCTHHTCDVKKQVQRLCKDTSIVVTTYEGIHNHPCEKLMEALAPLLKQLQFLTSIF